MPGAERVRRQPPCITSRVPLLCLPPSRALCARQDNDWEPNKGTLTSSGPSFEFIMKRNAPASLTLAKCSSGRNISFETAWAPWALCKDWWGWVLMFYNCYEKSSAHSLRESKAMRRVGTKSSGSRHARTWNQMTLDGSGVCWVIRMGKRV